MIRQRLKWRREATCTHLRGPCPLGPRPSLIKDTHTMHPIPPPCWGVLSTLTCHPSRITTAMPSAEPGLAGSGPSLANFVDVCPDSAERARKLVDARQSLAEIGQFRCNIGSRAFLAKLGHFRSISTQLLSIRGALGQIRPGVDRVWRCRPDLARVGEHRPTFRALHTLPPERHI